MNIELSSASALPAASPEGLGGKARGAGDAGAAEAGGFASVLMSLGGDAEAADLGEASPNEVVAKDDGAAVPAPVDGGQAADGSVPVSILPWMASGQLLQNKPAQGGSSAGGNLSQGQGRAPDRLIEIARSAGPLSAARPGGMEAGPTPAGAGSGQERALLPRGIAGAAGAVVATGTEPAKEASLSRQDTAAAMADMTPPADALLLPQRAVAESVPALAGAVSARREVLWGAAASEQAVQAGREQMVRQEGGAVELGANARSAVSKEAQRVSGVDAASQKGVPNNATDGQAHARLDLLEAMRATVPVLPDLAQAAGAGEFGARQTERSVEKMNIKSAEIGSWGMQALLTGSVRTDAMTVSAGAPVPSPEALIAEQVSYWISNDVQNAELKLDHLGPNPVEVSISLHGKDAHVEFRTDMPEVRQVLEGAVLHLKEMLQGEGLVLAGVSVGASGAGDSAPRDQSERQNTRQGAVPEAVALGGRSRALQASGRAVDIFV